MCRPPSCTSEARALAPSGSELDRRSLPLPAWLTEIDGNWLLSARGP